MNFGVAEKGEKCICRRGLAGGEPILYTRTFASVVREVIGCPGCHGALKEMSEKEEIVGDDEDFLPDSIDMPLLELRERQLAACTRMMKDAAVKLREWAATKEGFSEQMEELAQQLMNVRNGEIKDAHEHGDKDE